MKLTNADYPGITFSVYITYDGCANEPAVYSGDYEVCLKYMRRCRVPKYCGLDLKNESSGRFISYTL